MGYYHWTNYENVTSITSWPREAIRGLVPLLLWSHPEFNDRHKTALFLASSVVHFEISESWNLKNEWKVIVELLKSFRKNTAAIQSTFQLYKNCRGRYTASVSSILCDVRCKCTVMITLSDVTQWPWQKLEACFLLPNDYWTASAMSKYDHQ